MSLPPLMLTVSMGIPPCSGVIMTNDDINALSSGLPVSRARLPMAKPCDSTGFEIGWDYAQHRLTPPVDHLHEGHSVR